MGLTSDSEALRRDLGPTDGPATRTEDDHIPKPHARTAAVHAYLHDQTNKHATHPPTFRETTPRKL